MKAWKEIIKLDTVNSTNEYASKILKEKKLPEGTIIYSLEQTRGRGLGENSWESEKGKNILLSLVLYPKFLKVKDQFLLSKAISLGIANYCKIVTNHINIKWPNDIYYKDKKLAGILIENSIRGSQIDKSIIGIGLNLNQKLFLSDAPNPISLKKITGKDYSIDKEIISMRDNIYYYYSKLRESEYSLLNDKYLTNLYNYNKHNKYKSKDVVFEAKITGVNEFGHLQLITRDGEKKEFELKEIEFVI